MRAASYTPEVWFRFSKTFNGDEKVYFRWEQLPSHRYEEFIDFKMKYYVKYEVTHAVAGIYKNPEALEEYREIITKLYRHPSYHTSICCVDDESNKMVAFDSLRLYKSGEIYEDVIQAKTAELQRFYKLNIQLNNLCPVPNILIRYGVNQFFDDAGLSIHPDYRGYRFTTETALLRRIVCKTNNVPLTGAWMTSASVQNTTKYDGWDTIYEITSEELEETLGIEFPKSQIYMFKVKKI